MLFVTRDLGRQGVALRKNYIARSNLAVLGLGPEKVSGGKK